MGELKKRLLDYLEAHPDVEPESVTEEGLYA